jgi:hypothetical protein
VGAGVRCTPPLQAQCTRARLRAGGRTDRHAPQRAGNAAPGPTAAGGLLPRGPAPLANTLSSLCRTPIPTQCLPFPSSPPAGGTLAATGTLAACLSGATATAVHVITIDTSSTLTWAGAAVPAGANVLITPASGRTNAQIGGDTPLTVSAAAQLALSGPIKVVGNHTYTANVTGASLAFTSITFAPDSTFTRALITVSGRASLTVEKCSFEGVDNKSPDGAGWGSIGAGGHRVLNRRTRGPASAGWPASRAHSRAPPRRAGGLVRPGRAAWWLLAPSASLPA